MLGQTLPGQAGATGAWAALTARQWRQQDGHQWGRAVGDGSALRARDKKGLGAWLCGGHSQEPGGQQLQIAVLRAGPWRGLLTHLTSRCLCRSGPLPPSGSPGLTAPAPVGAGRAPQGCCWGSLGVTGGWGSFSPPLEALESHKGLECSGDGCVEGPRDTTWLPCSGEAGAGPGALAALGCCHSTFTHCH